MGRKTESDLNLFYKMADFRKVAAVGLMSQARYGGDQKKPPAVQVPPYRITVFCY